MASMSDSAQRAMMRCAKNIVAPAMRRIARIRTKTTAAAVNIVNSSEGIEVRAGSPTGAYGWTPIQASMFENNRRHPLFGNKHKWYHQGDFPITSLTLKLVQRQVEDEFTNEDLKIILGKHNL
jgi:hypothetical protein